MKLLSALILILFFSGDAYCYLDPGTGSYVLQMLIAGLAGALLAVKIFWQNIIAFFSGLFKKGRKKK